MIKFSKEKVLLLHRLIAEETGGSIGIRDEGLLEAALENALSPALEERSSTLQRKKRAHAWAMSSSPTTHLSMETSGSACM